MAGLMEFLKNKDIGVSRKGDLAHISVSAAEWITATVESLHLITPTFAVAGGSTVGVATVAGVGVAAVGPVLGTVAVFMALGSGYSEAREEIKNKAVARGFSFGFVAGILNFAPSSTKDLFGMHELIRTNAFDPEADVLEMKSYNRGLVAGYGFANTATAEQKKSFLFELRKFFPTDEPHRRWDDEEKKNYVLQYSIKLRLHYLTKVN
jgi:hypothetical protein